MLVRLVVTWFSVAVSIAIAAAVMPSVEVDGGVVPLLDVAVVFGLVNVLVGPVLRLMSTPPTLDSSPSS